MIQSITTLKTKNQYISNASISWDKLDNSNGMQYHRWINGKSIELAIIDLINFNEQYKIDLLGYKNCKIIYPKITSQINQDRDEYTDLGIKFLDGITENWIWRIDFKKITSTNEDGIEQGYLNYSGDIKKAFKNFSGKHSKKSDLISGDSLHRRILCFTNFINDNEIVKPFWISGTIASQFLFENKELSKIKNKNISYINTNVCSLTLKESIESLLFKHYNMGWIEND